MSKKKSNVNYRLQAYLIIEKLWMMAQDNKDPWADEQADRADSVLAIAWFELTPKDKEWVHLRHTDASRSAEMNSTVISYIESKLK